MDTIIKYELLYTSKNNVLTRDKITNLNTKKVTETVPANAVIKSTTSSTTGPTVNVATKSTTNSTTGPTVNAATKSTTSSTTEPTENASTEHTENASTESTEPTESTTTSAATVKKEPYKPSLDDDGNEIIDKKKKMRHHEERTWSPLTENGDTNIDHDTTFDNTKFDKYFELFKQATSAMILLFYESSPRCDYTAFYASCRDHYDRVKYGNITGGKNLYDYIKDNNTGDDGDIGINALIHACVDLGDYGINVTLINKQSIERITHSQNMRMVYLLVENDTYLLYRKKVISQQDFTKLFKEKDDNFDKIQKILPFHSFTNHVTDLEKNHVISYFTEKYNRNIIIYTTTTDLQNEDINYNIKYYGENTNHDGDIYISYNLINYHILIPIQKEENKVDNYKDKKLYMVACDILDNAANIEMVNGAKKYFDEKHIIIMFKELQGIDITITHYDDKDDIIGDIHYDGVYYINHRKRPYAYYEPDIKHFLKNINRAPESNLYNLFNIVDVEKAMKEYKLYKNDNELEFLSNYLKIRIVVCSYKDNTITNYGIYHSSHINEVIIIKYDDNTYNIITQSLTGYEKLRLSEFKKIFNPTQVQSSSLKKSHEIFTKMRTNITENESKKVIDKFLKDEIDEPLFETIKTLVKELQLSILLWDISEEMDYVHLSILNHH